MITQKVAENAFKTRPDDIQYKLDAIWMGHHQERLGAVNMGLFVGVDFNM